MCLGWYGLVSGNLPYVLWISSASFGRSVSWCLNRPASPKNILPEFPLLQEGLPSSRMSRWRLPFLVCCITHISVNTSGINPKCRSAVFHKNVIEL